MGEKPLTPIEIGLTAAIVAQIEDENRGFLGIDFCERLGNEFSQRLIPLGTGQATEPIDFQDVNRAIIFEAQARGLGTCGYDDDGVKTSEFTIIEKGIFRNYQTTREQAHLVGDKESHGCCQADSWATVPFQRMPNVSLRPGPSETTLDSLISGIDDGVLIDGRGSYSIDQ